MTEQRVFQAAFESYAPEALQMAYDFCDAHEDVRRFWVIAMTGKSIGGNAVYDVNGQILMPHQLDQQIPDLDCSVEAQLDQLLGPLTDLTVDLASRVREAGEEMPQRIIMRYDVLDENMEASLTYDDLQPGVAEEDRLDAGTLVDRWVERLRTRGSDSAEP